MDSCLSQIYLREIKHEQSRPGFKLASLVQFSTTLTVALSASPYVCKYVCMAICVCGHIYITICLPHIFPGLMILGKDKISYTHACVRVWTYKMIMGVQGKLSII